MVSFSQGPSRIFWDLMGGGREGKAQANADSLFWGHS